MSVNNPVSQCAAGKQVVAASQSTKVLGATGAAGDYLSHIVIMPAAAAAGAVTLFDGVTSIIAFPGGGTTAVKDLMPVTVFINCQATTNWNITTGASASVLAVGNFT